LLARCFGCYANHTNNIQVMTNFTLEEFDKLTLQVIPIIQVHAKSIPKMFHVANEKSQHAPTRRISNIWMNRVLSVRIYLFWNLDAWGHSKIIKDCMDEGKTPLLLGNFSWNNGGREAQNGPPSSPQNVMLLFYGLPIYFFAHLPNWFFSFLKIRNRNHSKLPISKPSHWLHEISISKTVCHHFQPGLIPHYKLGVLIQVSIH
jgi:hypothetical protein